jgi:hypothetical protein
VGLTELLAGAASRAPCNCKITAGKRHNEANALPQASAGRRVWRIVVADERRKARAAGLGGHPGAALTSSAAAVGARGRGRTGAVRRRVPDARGPSAASGRIGGTGIKGAPVDIATATGPEDRFGSRPTAGRAPAVAEPQGRVVGGSACPSRWRARCRPPPASCRAQRTDLGGERVEVADGDQAGELVQHRGAWSRITSARCAA